MKRTATTLAKRTWFGEPPPRSKHLYCSGKVAVPGFPEDTPRENPFWMDDVMTGKNKHAKRGVSVESLNPGKTWEGNEDLGVPGMPPSDYFGNKLIPRDEVSKFMPDIYIDGLADEIQGEKRTMAKHIVPHQFHDHYDESLITESWKGNRPLSDKSREMTWRANMSLYMVRHPLADDWQRKMMIGDREAQDRFQDPDDLEYEREILQALQRGDTDRATSVYKRLTDPPKNWEVFKALLAHFASRGLLADAIAVYDEMEVFGIPPDGAAIASLVTCAVAAEHPMRVSWAAGEARKTFGGVGIPSDWQASIGKQAVKYLLSVGSAQADTLASRIYATLKSDGLLGEMDAIQAKAQSLLAQAEALGIMPDTEGCDGGHHHRYARSVLPSNGTRPGVEGGGGAAGAAASASHASYALTEGEVSRLEALISPEADEAVPMPYFKKSAPNHLLQGGVVKSFDYDVAKVSERMRYPSTRSRGPTGDVDPRFRFTFRWAGPQTRMVNVHSADVSPSIEM